MMGRNMGDQSYVMDVRLKREYATGYMSNLETGMGTKDRYQVRGFGMKFSNKERIGAFVNINNLNDNQRAELNGEWKPQDMPDGLLATKTAGLSYLNFLKVPARLADFCRNMNERHELLKDNNDIIAQYALSFDAHNLLVAIHPWVDGNGRMSRRQRFAKRLKRVICTNCEAFVCGIRFCPRHGMGTRSLLE